MSSNNQRRSNNSLAAMSGRPQTTRDPKEKFRVFFIVLVLLLNIINTLIYNTGAFAFSKDEFDIIWSTAIVCFDVSAILFALFLGKEKLD